MSAPSVRRWSRSSWIISRRLNCENPLWMLYVATCSFTLGRSVYGRAIGHTGKGSNLSILSEKPHNGLPRLGKLPLLVYPLRRFRVADPGHFSSFEESSRGKSRWALGRERQQGEGARTRVRATRLG